MASTIKVDKLDPQSGTALEIGTSGDTVTVPSGVGLTLTDSTLLLPTTINTDKIDPKSGTALEIGTSGDTITVPTGAGLTVTDEVKTNKISPATGTAFALGDSGDTFTVPSGATIVNSGTATGFGGGKIGQVVQTINTGTETLSSTTLTTIPDFTVTITPAATSSKILVMVNFFISGITDYFVNVQLYRDTTAIYLGDVASNRPRGFFGTQIRSAYTAPAVAGCYLDSPSTTSAVAYSCKWNSEASSAIYMGRTSADADQTTYTARTPSTITVMEVLA